MTEPQTFTMNTLAGVDHKGEDIIIPQELWTTLTPHTYQGIVGAFGLTEKVRLTECLERYLGYDRDLRVESMAVRHYDPAAVVVIASAVLEGVAHEVAGVPGAAVDLTSDETAMCERVRFPLSEETACLLPVLLVTGRPPSQPTPLIRHELVHLRRTIGWQEQDIRDSYWNADLQQEQLSQFYAVVGKRIREHLAEERLACRENFAPGAIDGAFDAVYIPQTLHRVGVLLDWYVNDMGQQLDLDRLAKVVRRSLTETLANGGYGRHGGPDSRRLGALAERVMRRAYQQWEQTHGPYDSLVIDAMRAEFGAI